VGGAGVDTFLFNRGEANGDTVTDFAGDAIGFIGYGQGSFVRLDDTHWQVTSQDGATQETITFANAANILASDYHFL